MTGERLDGAAEPETIDPAHLRRLRELATGRRENGADRHEVHADPAVARLKSLGLYQRPRGDGRHLIVCPWVDAHTGLDDSGTVYMEAHHGGHRRASFVCQHSHCGHRRLGDLLDHLGLSDPAEIQPAGFRSLLELRTQLRGADFLVKPLLERDSVSLWFGDSDTYKSFVALALGLSLAHDRSFYGLPTHGGPVFYVCGEGHGGIARRAAAWALDQGLEEDAPFYVSEIPAAFFDPGNAAALGGEIGAIAERHTPGASRRGGPTDGVGRLLPGPWDGPMCDSARDKRTDSGRVAHPQRGPGVLGGLSARWDGSGPWPLPSGQPGPRRIGGGPGAPCRLGFGPGRSHRGGLSNPGQPRQVACPVSSACRAKAEPTHTGLAAAGAWGQARDLLRAAGRAGARRAPAHPAPRDGPPLRLAPRPLGAVRQARRASPGAGGTVDRVGRLEARPPGAVSLVQARGAQTPGPRPGGRFVRDCRIQSVPRLGALLEAHGYRPKGRDRWLAPSSESRLPGVVRLPEWGRILSHHGGEPLATGHALDAFEVLSILEHGGDTGAAVRAAAAALGLSSP